MGTLVSAECEHCNASEIFYLGSGMMLSSIENVWTGVPSHAKNRIKEVIENHGVTSTYFEYDLFECEVCNTLHGRFNVILEYDGDQIFKIQFRCGKCRNLLKEAGLGKCYKCKDCGEKSVSLKECGLWD